MKALIRTRSRWMIGSLVLIAAGAGCASPGKKTAVGAGAGGAGGAIIGAVAGGPKGAAIGAAAGAIAGGAIGNYFDKQKQELDKVAETRRTQDGLLVQLKNDLLFDTGSAVVKPGATAQLQQLGATLAKYPDDKINVQGFTDNQGGEAVNKKLSEARAESVRNALTSSGVKPEQIASQGLGESKPVASNKTADGRAKNRRVELHITAPEAKA